MSSVMSGRDRERGAFGGFPPVRALWSEGFVLPRWLRRPARVFGRLTSGDLVPPRFSATIMTAGFLAVSVIYGAQVGGHMPAVVQALTARSGFAVDQVRVTGHVETSEIDILDALALDGWTSLIGFDAEEARERVSALPWVQGAAIRKIYPDTIEVEVEERKPYAIWQHGNELSVVEASGRPIAPFSGGRQAALPLVIGVGANEAASAFIGKIKGYPELASRVKGYIRVAERRWDLRLESGITVKLPESGEDEAIVELLAMDRDNALLSRDIVSVDLRLTDRVVVQLTPEGVERRAAALAESAKARKRLEKKI